MKELEYLNMNSEKMLEEMTQAGAKVVYENIKSAVPESFRKSNIMRCLLVTRSYKTPSDDGINTKVAFYGYFMSEDGRKTPAPLVCNVTEYGNSSGTYPKHPFMRRSFKKAEIERAMKAVQDKYIKG